MPLYDYKCKKCEHVFESLHKIADPGPSECPECGHNQVSKLISAVHGSVELTGHDLKAKINEDARKLKQQADKDPKVLANLVGEDKYQQNVVTSESIKKEFGKE